MRDLPHAAVVQAVTAFTHSALPEFFAGQHQGVAVREVPRRQARPARRRGPALPVAGWTFKNLPTACATCHKDVHLGQVGTACEACHVIDAAKFARRQVQPRADGVPADRPPRAGRVPEVPQAGEHARAVPAPAHEHGRARSRALGTDVRVVPPGRAPRPARHASCEACHTPAVVQGAELHARQPRRRSSSASTRRSPVRACHKPEAAVFPAGTRHRGPVHGHAAPAASVPHRTRTGLAGPTLRGLPHAGALARRRRARSTRPAVFPLEGRHLAVAVREVPRQRAVTGHADEVLRLPLGPAPGRSVPDAAGQPTARRATARSSWTAVTWNHGAAPARRSARRTARSAATAATRTAASTPAARRATRATRSGLPGHDAAGAPGRRLPDAVRGVPQAVAHLVLAGHASSTTRTSRWPGVHATQACASCHKNGVYKGTPRDCVGCHRTTYERTTSPNHAAAGFPTTCESCHRPTDRELEGRRSTTAASSRSSACTRRRRARPATRTTSTRARRATASAATARPTSARRARTTRPRVPDDVRVVPPAVGRRAGGRRSTTAASSRSSACTPRRPARRATRTTSTRARRATASAATARPTSARPTRTTRRPGSRRRASRATGPSDASWSGDVQPQQRSSRSSACTRRRPARRATRTTSTRARRATASAATARPTSARPTRTTPPPASRRRATRATARRRPRGRRASITTGSSSSPGATSRRPARRATRTTSTGARRATATRATRRSTTARRTRTTGRPGSRRPARRATGTRTTSFNQGRFNHTWFPITSGKHAGRACAECHTDPNNYKVFTCTTVP